MSNGARYDGLADWYREFRPALDDCEVEALERLLGRGTGRDRDYPHVVALRARA